MVIENYKKYTGTLKSPSSKSFMQRAIAISLMADGTSYLSNPCFCNDVSAVLEIAKILGAEVRLTENEVIIIPNNKLKSYELNVGESGLGIRMLTPLAALHPQSFTLLGEGSLKKRPMQMLEKPLKDLGVTIQTNNGYLPITVKGPLKGGNVEVDGSISSQILSGLLMALPKTEKSSKIEVLDLQSKPYVDVTMQIMRDFGVKVSHENHTIFHIPGAQNYSSKKYKIEGDWSGSSFHLVGAAISGDVTLTDIDSTSLQADVKILDALRMAGAEVTTDSNSVRVVKNKLNAFNFDARHCPDLFPPLSNLAVACDGISVIRGVDRLVYKESNRAKTIQEEWGKMGVKVELLGDEMHITGGKINGGMWNSHNDHRIAMMGAVASLNAQNPITITQSSSVNKSYPNFFSDFKYLSSFIM